MVGRLEYRILVRHTGPYWAITDDEERLYRAYDLHRATRLLDKRLGDENPDEWLGEADSA